MRGEKGKRRLEIREERGGGGKERRGREWMGVKMRKEDEFRSESKEMGEQGGEQERSEGKKRSRVVKRRDKKGEGMKSSG